MAQPSQLGYVTQQIFCFFGGKSSVDGGLNIHERQQIASFSNHATPNHGGKSFLIFKDQARFTMLEESMWVCLKT